MMFYSEKQKLIREAIAKIGKESIEQPISVIVSKELGKILVSGAGNIEFEALSKIAEHSTQVGACVALRINPDILNPYIQIHPDEIHRAYHNLEELNYVPTEV